MRRFFVVSFLLILLGAGCTQEYEKRYDEPAAALPGQEIEINEDGNPGAPAVVKTESTARVMVSSTAVEPEPPAEPASSSTSSAAQPVDVPSSVTMPVSSGSVGSASNINPIPFIPTSSTQGQTTSFVSTSSVPEPEMPFIPTSSTPESETPFVPTSSGF